MFWCALLKTADAKLGTQVIVLLCTNLPFKANDMEFREAEQRGERKVGRRKEGKESLGSKEAPGTITL